MSAPAPGERGWVCKYVARKGRGRETRERGFKGRKCNNSAVSSPPRLPRQPGVSRQNRSTGALAPGHARAGRHLYTRDIPPVLPDIPGLWVEDPGLLARAGLPPCRSRSRLCPAHRTLTYSASGPIPDFSGQAPSQLTVNCRTGRKLSPTSPLFWFSRRF